MNEDISLFAKLQCIYEFYTGLDSRNTSFSEILNKIRAYFPGEESLNSDATLNDLRKWADNEYKELP